MLICLSLVCYDSTDVWRPSHFLPALKKRFSQLESSHLVLNLILISVQEIHSRENNMDASC